MLVRNGSKENTHLSLCRVQTCAVTMQISVTVFQEYVMCPNSAIDIYLKDTSSYYVETSSTMFIATLFIITKNWKQRRCLSTEDWKQEMWYTYIMTYYSGIRKHGIMKIKGKSMDLGKKIIRSEVFQNKKYRYDMHSLKCRK